MRLGCLEGLLPGEAIEERFQRAASLGLNGVEFLVFPDTDLAALIRDLERGAAQSGLCVCALIACQNLLDHKHLAWFTEVLESAAQLDAAVVLTPEYAGHDPPPGAPPFPPAPAEELMVLESVLASVASQAERLGARVGVEAINRYETRFARSLCDAADLGARAGSTMGIVADLFHMNIEEDDIASALRQAGTQLVHVHLADSNRYAPGHGHLDFLDAFGALKAIGYDGFLSMECGLPQHQPDALARAVRYVREKWSEARAA